MEHSEILGQLAQAVIDMDVEGVPARGRAGEHGSEQSEATSYPIPNAPGLSA